MKRVVILPLAVLLALVAANGCARQSTPLTPPGTGEPPRARSSDTTLQTARLGQMHVFLADAVTDPATARIIVVMHGTDRNADTYRDTWAPLIAGRNAIVLVPQFDEARFPGARGYNLGSMQTRSGEARPPQDWAWPGIVEMVDAVRRSHGLSRTDFALFGHSAGAQFVHRFLQFADHSRVSRAVAANAGWYTMPDPKVEFPFGWKDAPAVDEPGYFSADLTLLLGADDIASENLRTDADANRQGHTRLERGMTYFLAARQRAETIDAPLHWSLRVIPGVHHDHRPTSEAAADILLQ